MKNICLVFIFSFLFFSCGDKKNSSVPASVLPKEKMTEVLKDIHLAEAEASIQSKPDSLLKQKINFQKIFEKDSVTKQQYEESLTFYMDHPELLDKIYEQVINDLSRMQGEAAKK